MIIRTLIAALPVVLLGACEEAADTSAPRQASACLGLSQADCATRESCAWDASRSRCEEKTVPQSPAPTAPQ